MVSQGWPKDWPRYYNGCAEPCDTIVGPCCCGAWHQEGEFVWAPYGTDPTQPHPTLFRAGRIVYESKLKYPRVLQDDNSGINKIIGAAPDLPEPEVKQPQFVYVIIAYDWIATRVVGVAATPEKAAEKVEEYKRKPKYKDVAQWAVEKFNLIGG